MNSVTGVKTRTHPQEEHYREMVNLYKTKGNPHTSPATGISTQPPVTAQELHGDASSNKENTKAVDNSPMEKHYGRTPGKGKSADRMLTSASNPLTQSMDSGSTATGRTPKKEVGRI